MSEPAAEPAASNPVRLGSAQDAATIQANERTLLAWIRISDPCPIADPDPRGDIHRR